MKLFTIEICNISAKGLKSGPGIEDAPVIVQVRSEEEYSAVSAAVRRTFKGFHFATCEIIGQSRYGQLGTAAQAGGGTNLYGQIRVTVDSVEDVEENERERAARIDREEENEVWSRVMGIPAYE
jgi:hypothetical protein